MRTIDQETLNSFLQDSEFPYHTIKKLPASGQRDVYLAIDLQTDVRFVIKVAHYNKYSIGRIQREIKVLNMLDSPFFSKITVDTFIAGTILDQYYENIFTAAKSLDENHNALKEEYLAKVKDYQENPIRPFYLTVEEFVENIPWPRFIAEASELEKFSFIKDCFLSLDLLWQHKIAHRDLKPDNILIRPRLTPVVIDLGIAKSFNDGTQDLTPDFFKNPHTVRFASPEQILDRKDEINYKSDQYSMGLLSYYLLCGKLPFGTMEDIGPDGVFHNMMNFRYTSIAESGGQCCIEFEDFIKKLLKPEPHQRYRTSKRIFQHLESIHGALQ